VCILPNYTLESKAFHKILLPSMKVAYAKSISIGRTSFNLETNNLSNDLVHHITTSNWRSLTEFGEAFLSITVRFVAITCSSNFPLGKKILNNCSDLRSRNMPCLFEEMTDLGFLLCSLLYGLVFISMID